MPSCQLLFSLLKGEVSNHKGIFDEMMTPDMDERDEKGGAENAPRTEHPARERVMKKSSTKAEKAVPAGGGNIVEKKDSAMTRAEAAQARKNSGRNASSRTLGKKMAAGTRSVAEKSAESEGVSASAAVLPAGSEAARDADLSSARLPESPVMEDSLRHGRHVAALSASLFDQLAELHKLDETWRNRLVMAARLHDIGFAEGRKGHHKTGMRYIEEDLSLNISDADRPLVALLARYHRKAWPSRRHSRFAALPRRERRALRRAAALLRIADGLDYTHGELVKGCIVDIRPRRVILVLDSAGDCPEERARAVKKGDLFTHVFGRELECVCQAG